MSITAEKKQELIKTHATAKDDTGHPKFKSLFCPNALRI